MAKSQVILTEAAMTEGDYQQTVAIAKLEKNTRNIPGVDSNSRVGADILARFGPGATKLKVFQNLALLAMTLVLQITDIARRSRFERVLKMHVDNENNRDLVQSLACSNMYHTQLGALVREFECDASDRMRNAIINDRTIMCRDTRALLESPEGRASILALENDDASDFYVFLQKLLYDPEFIQLDANSHKAMCHAGSLVLIKLSQRLHRLPDKFLIEGVALNQSDPVKCGGSADIYVGRYLGRSVAVKRLRMFHDTHSSTSAKTFKNFVKKALVWHNLQHPNVVPLLGIDAGAFIRQRLYIVSPWMNNRDINSYMEIKILSTEDCNRLLLEVANGLAYLHGQDIVHGDIRGGNILINDNGHACLIDFVLADFTDIASTTSMRSGSTRWMAPELLRPEKYGMPFRRTTASDVYAYGCVCVEVYAEHPPFSKFAPIEAVWKAMEGVRPDRPLAADSRTRCMDDVLWKLINACWQETAEHRPSMPRVVTILNESSKGCERVSVRFPGHPDRHERSDILKPLNSSTPVRKLDQRRSVDHIRTRRTSQTSTSTTTPIPHRRRLTSTPSVAVSPSKSDISSPNPTKLPTTPHPRTQLQPKSRTLLSTNALPNPSFEMYLCLTRLLPPELVIPILNTSHHFHLTHHVRHLQTVLSARGLCAIDCEKRRKVYLTVDITPRRCDGKVAKVVWVIRMPSLLKREEGRGSLRKPGSIVWPFEVSLYRRRCDGDEMETLGNTHRPSASLLFRPAGLRIITTGDPTLTSYISSIPTNPSTPSKTQNHSEEILRVRLPVQVPSHPITRYVVSSPDLVQSLNKHKGDMCRMCLVLPAVYGKEAGKDKSINTGGNGNGSEGFARGEIWEAEVFVYEEW